MNDKSYELTPAPSWTLSLLNGLRHKVCLVESKNIDICRSGLTSFPNPGEPGRPIKELTTNFEFQESRGAINDKVLNAKTSDGQSRNFWMPDRLCKSCYECELQFNMFRRRHHCRFCGQVFCHSCASFFVDGKSVFLSGIVRACRLCHDQVSLAPMTSTHIPIAYSRSFGSRFKEPGNSAAYDLRSLTTLHDMDLQQEFEDDFASVIDGTSTQSSNQVEIYSDRKAEASTLLTTSGGPDSSITKTNNKPGVPPSYMECSGDGLHKSNFTKSAEADLRQRLLRSSSIATPSMMGSIIARTVRSVADLIHLRCHLSSNAAQHLRALVQSLSYEIFQDRELWGTIILRLVERACRMVNVDVSAGDHMDIRPYIKLKTIAGGDPRESRYMDGIVYCKSLVHKRMARACRNPRVLLLSGGIDFQRTSSRLASFGTLMEQEQRYTQIMVERLIRSRANLLLVGKSISRQAQEYLIQHEIVVMQNIKPTLMATIARMTGGTILSSTDHVNTMGQLGCAPLGCCQKFQTMAYSSVFTLRGMIKNYSDPNIFPTNLKSYVCLLGCPGILGCTLILRGANAPVLKKVKHVVRFAIYVAYHLRLETSYLSDSGATFPPLDRSTLSCNAAADLLSVSLAVRFDDLNHQTKLAPFFANVPLTTAYDHQSLLVTSVWMSQSTQCASAEVKSICFYTPQDVCLGQFLLDSCFNLDLRLSPGDKRTVLDMTQIFYHNTSQLTITVIYLDQSLPTNAPRNHKDDDQATPKDWPILMWSYCRKCEQVVTPLTPMSRDTWNISFGKFLEISFYNKLALCGTTDCRHCIQSDHVRFFGCGRFAARVEHDDISPYGIHLRTSLPFDCRFHTQKLKEQHHRLHGLFHQIFHQFRQKIVQLKSLLNIVSNLEDAHLPRYPTSIRSEIHKISDELLQHSSKMENNLEVVRGDCENLLMPHRRPASPGVLHFPGQYRRELHVRCTNWNAQISLLGRLLTSLVGSSPAIRADLIVTEISKLQVMKLTFQSTVRQQDERETDEDDLEEGLNEHLEQNATYEEADICLNWKDNKSAKALALVATSDAIGIQTIESDHCAHLMDNSFLDLVSAPQQNPPKQQESIQEIPVDCSQIEGVVQSPKGGTYKLSSPLTRLMIKEGQQKEPWTVDLRNLVDSWPCFDTSSRGGQVLLVHEGKPTTIIAYSLSTVEYRNVLQTHLRKNPAPTAEVRRGLAEVSAIGAGNIPCTTLSVHSKTADSVICTNVATGNRSLSTKRSIACNDGPLFSPWAEGLASLVRSNENKSAIEYVSECTKGPKFIIGADQYYSFVKIAAPGTTASADLRNNIESRTMDIIEWELLSQRKSHVKHRFADIDEKGNTLCKFVCQTYWATQFAAVRQAYVGIGKEEELGYLRSLSMAQPWNAQGGKSGATFLKTDDGRFVVKQITRTELQMFLEYAPAYFEYLSKSFFHQYSTLLVKVLGVYQIGSHNRVNGKRIMEQVVVMENLFHECSITCAFDLKGSTRSRYARVSGSADGGKLKPQQELAESSTFASCRAHPVLLDENFVEFTNGRPLPMHDQAKAYFNSAVLNDTLFLSLINVVDYSILVGLNEEQHELVVGIIDYMRQYDIIKKMERMGKSVGMIAGQAEPTVIQPPNYRNRFQAAMERYFMMVPDKWTLFRMRAREIVGPHPPSKTNSFPADLGTHAPEITRYNKV